MVQRIVTKRLATMFHNRKVQEAGYLDRRLFVVLQSFQATAGIADLKIGHDTEYSV
jgi:hypothetical protein